MAIEIKCPSCKATIQVPDDVVGKMATCPQCHHEFLIPAEEPAAKVPPEPQTLPLAAQAGARLEAPRSRVSAQATMSLVLGILSPFFCILTGIPAIILGALALSSINRSKGALTGSGRAIAGICLGGASVLFVVTLIPRTFQGWVSANETGAVGSLKTLATSQELFKKACEVDQNGNGIGEYGLLGELCGWLALRPAGTTPVRSPFIASEFREGLNEGLGYARAHGGYLYKIYLSNATVTDPILTGSDLELGGTPTTGGPKASEAAIKLQEEHFVIYAWPADLHRTGERAFVVTERGQVYGTRMTDAAGRPGREYNGETSVPAADAAFIGPVFTGKLSSGRTPGNDCNQWNPVGG